MVTDHKPLMTILGPKRGLPTLQLDSRGGLSCMPHISTTLSFVQPRNIVTPTSVDAELKPYANRRQELTVEAGCLLLGDEGDSS